MAALTNTSDSTALNAALDQEFIANFQHDSDRLAEILGIFGTETLAAGTTLKMLKITGTLNNGKTDGTQVGATGTGAVTLGSSSGTSYVEGDEVALSKFSAEYDAVAEVFGVPYRKMTTANAIQKSGYVNAVLKTDQKMLSQVRGGVVSDFFTFLGNGTGTASAKGLQAALATADATLGDKLEDNGDEAGRIIHFVNRQDVAAYLAGAAITTQTVFGMDYLENFLGVRDVFVTSRVEKGYIYATPVDNIHLYACDFGALAEGGLSYTTSELGVVGIHHEPNYARNVVETQALLSFAMLPEVVDYISKTRIGKPMGDMSVDELKALAEAEGVDITGKTTKEAITEALTGAGVR